MRVDRITSKRKKYTYTSILLRHAYRDANKKVKHKTLLNLTHHHEEDIAAIEFALKNKKKLPQILDLLNQQDYNPS